MRGISSSGNISTTGSAYKKQIQLMMYQAETININASIITSDDATLGSINVSGNTIQSNNSNTITFNDNVSTNTNKLTVNGTEYGD